MHLARGLSHHLRESFPPGTSRSTLCAHLETASIFLFLNPIALVHHSLRAFTSTFAHLPSFPALLRIAEPSLFSGIHRGQIQDAALMWTRDQPLVFAWHCIALPYFSLPSANTLLAQIPSHSHIPPTILPFNLSLLWNSSRSWILNKHLAPSNALGRPVARYVTRGILIDQNSLLITTVELQQKIRPAEAFQDTHKRAALPMHSTRLWKGLHPAQCPDRSHTHAHRRKATCLPVRWMWKAIFRCRSKVHDSCRTFADNVYQSSSLARHRRIHSGKRPYMCGHHGCVKT